VRDKYGKWELGIIDQFLDASRKSVVLQDSPARAYYHSSFTLCGFGAAQLIFLLLLI
jgi:hypothetical protein